MINSDSQTSVGLHLLGPIVLMHTEVTVRCINLSVQCHADATVQMFACSPQGSEA